jgi:hypothetical protein
VVFIRARIDHKLARMRVNLTSRAFGDASAPYGYGSLMNFRNSRDSSGVAGRPPYDRIISSARSSDSTPLAGYQFTGFTRFLRTTLVGAEEAGMLFVVFLAVAEGMVENDVQT